MKALIIGATGVTGKDLVNVLLNDPAYLQVIIFVRRSIGISHTKLVETITDFDKLEDIADSIRGDVWFSLLGTTLKAAGSKEKQWHIDYEIPMNFATIAKRNAVPKTVLLSAYGASVKSNVFYSKLKGRLEDDITGLGFAQLVIFRPGLLLRKNSDRFFERLSATILKLLNRVGLVRKFRPMPTLLLAEKLAKAAKEQNPAIKIIELDSIFNY